MADFDAGSIIASMELDRDPYTQGLNAAKKQGADFEKSKLTKTIEADTKPADAKLDEFDERLDRLREDHPTITPEIDTKPAEEQLARLGAEERAAGRSGQDAGEGISILTAAIALLAPAIGPIVGVSLAGMSALLGGVASGAVQAGAALAPFALTAKADFTSMTTSLKAVQAAQKAAFNATTPQAYAAAIKALTAAQAGLVGPAGAAASAYQSLQASMKGLQSSTAGPVFAVMTDAFRTAARLLPILAPLINTTAQALLSSVDALGRGLGGTAMTKFLTMTERNTIPDIHKLTVTLGAFGHGLLELLMDFNPLGQSMLTHVDKLSVSFSHWSDVSAKGDITKMLAYLANEGPKLGDTLLRMAEAVIKLVHGLSPLSGGTFFALRLFSDLILALPTWAITALGAAIIPVIVGIKLVTTVTKGWGLATTAWTSATKFGTKALALFGWEMDATRIKILALRAEIMLLKAAIWTIQLAQDAWAAAAAVDWIAILGPIGIVLAAFAALGFAVYEIIKHWRGLMTFYIWLWHGIEDGFHAIAGVVIDVFDFIKKHWMLMTSVLLGPIALATYEIVKHFNTVKGWVEDLPGLVEDAFKDLAEIIFWPWKTAFNLIADAWDDTVGKLSFHLPGWVPGFGGDGFKMPQIPHLATGGVANRSTLAVVGDDGPEAIVPLDKDTVLSKSNSAQTAMLAKVLAVLTQIHAATLAGPAQTATGVAETIGEKFTKAQQQTGLAVAMAGRAG